MAMFSPQAQRVFHNPTPLDTTNDMFNSHANASNATVLRFLVRRQGLLSRLFLRLFCPHSSDDQALKAAVLIQDTIIGELILFLIGHRFIVPTAFVRRTYKVDATIIRNQQQIFDRMLLLLPTKMEPLFIHIAGSVYRSFGAIMEKKVALSESMASAGAAPWMNAVRDGR